MRNLSTSLVAAALLLVQVPASAQTPASAPAEAMAVVHRWLGAFNDGNPKEFCAACAGRVSAIDEFPPYAWQGSRGCREYWKDFAEYSENEGLSHAAVTFGEPSLVELSGNDLYMVAPASLTFTLKGKPVTESGAFLTVTLHEGRRGWKITGWAWSNPG